VAHEAQLAGGLAFTVEPRIRIGAGFVRGVATGLAFEIGADVVAAGVFGVLGVAFALAAFTLVVFVVVAFDILVLAALEYKALVSIPARLAPAMLWRLIQVPRHRGRGCTRSG
jgi:phage shock protein PspC (stress-responsive transcriptional regulator)